MEEPKNNSPRIIARVNDATSDLSLERMLRSRAAAQRATPLIDHSLPTDLRWRGLTLPQGTALPIQRSHRREHSPFVLSLRAPELEMTGDIARVNMLEGRLAGISPTHEHTLALSREDLAGQLSEETVPTLQAPKAARRHATITLPDLSAFRREAEMMRKHAVAQGADGMDVSHFVPKAMPTAFAHTFDLPEADEEEAEDTLMEFEPETGVVMIETTDDEEVSGPIHETVEREEEVLVPERAEAPRRLWHIPQLRTLGAFVLLSFAVVLPLHAMNLVGVWSDARDTVLTQSEAGAALLSSGATSALSRDAGAAARAFAGASTSFAQAGDAVSDLGVAANTIIAALPANSTVASGRSVLEAGTSLATAGQRIADGINSLGNDPLASPTDRVNLLRAYLEGALPHLKKAQKALAKADPAALPENTREDLTLLKETLPRVVSGIQELIDVASAANAVLGEDGTKRYLAVFQNNTEIRPTGGFMGSFAEMDLSHGEIARLSIPGGGTYDLRAGVTTPYIAPKPLRLLSAAWEFQDANWFPDFPTSARQVMQFYEHAGGPTVDGVVAVNATFVAGLLELVGPIEMPEYGRTIDKDNFLLETQKIVELEYDKEENAPKAFIGDLAPKLLERAKSLPPEQFLAFLDRLQQGLAARDIQIYFANQDLQKQVIARGWGGELQWTDSDYLMVVDTNLGGGKTDGVIEQNVDMQVHIKDDGSVENTVTIKRTHFGEAGSAFSGVNNVDYLRLYVPKGSQLVEADGFSIPDAVLFEAPLEDWIVDDDLLYSTDGSHKHNASGTDVYEESGKTVFGNWMQVKPGTSSTATFRYNLPFKVDVGSADPNLLDRIKKTLGLPKVGRYTLTIQKQSGILDRTTTVHLTSPEAWNTVWSSHEVEGTAFTNATDAFFAAIFEKPSP